jgi:hypothetical protein
VLAEEAASGGALRIEGAMAHWLPSYVPYSVHKHLAQ